MVDTTILVGDRLRSLLDATEEQVSNEDALEIWQKLESMPSEDQITIEDFGNIVKQQLPGFQEIAYVNDNSDLDAILDDLKNRQT